MKNPKIQNLKIIIAIVFFIVTSMIIYNYKKLERNIAVITKDDNANFAQIKYTKGTEITEVKQKDGNEQEKNQLELHKQNELLPNKIDLNISDDASPENVEEIDTKVLEDSIIISFNKPKDNGTNYEYQIKKDNNERTVKYYAKSEIKGYSYLIDNEPNSIASKDINKLDESPIVKQNINWNDDYYLHIRTIDNNDNYSENNTFKVELPSEGLSMKYIDINTGEEIESEETIKGITKQEYDANDRVKEIDDYQLININGDLNGKLQKDRIKIDCNYAKKLRVQIDYINKDTGEKIIDSTYLDGYEGKETVIKAKEVEGYNYIKKEIPIIMEAEKNQINIYYKEIPKGIVSVKYVDEKTLENISDEYYIEDYFNNEYITEAKEIEGYELISEPENSEGVIIDDDTEVVYYYRKIEEELVNENERCVKYVDYDTKKNIMTEKIKPNKENLINIKNIEGYRIMSKDEFDKDESLIDELIKSLDINKDFTQELLKGESVILPKNKKDNNKSEYEIVMNCDDSDYIIYYKK